MALTKRLGDRDRGPGVRVRGQAQDGWATGGPAPAAVAGTAAAGFGPGGGLRPGLSLPRGRRRRSLGLNFELG